MRIIAGVAKGRALGNVADATRPTSDRAREGLFSSLTSEFGSFSGLHVLDLFSGSGAIGLEAFSRGASIVHAIEQDPEAQKTIEHNCALVKKNQPVGEFHLYAMSAHRFVTESAKESYDIVYIDPPFDFADTGVEEILRRLELGGFLKDGALIAVERTAKGSKFSWPEGFSPARERSYGAVSIFYGYFNSKNG